MLSVIIKFRLRGSLVQMCMVYGWAIIVLNTQNLIPGIDTNFVLLSRVVATFIYDVKTMGHTF